MQLSLKSSFCRKITGPAEKISVWGHSDEYDNAG
jgi:hypothetical protein